MTVIIDVPLQSYNILLGYNKLLGYNILLL